MTSKIRLYVPASYEEECELSLEIAQSHYLVNVMRCKEGGAVAVFNGKDGVWRAEITYVSKKHVTLTLKNRIIAQICSPDIWFAFAPIKNKTELVVEKATELGASYIFPVFMKHNVVRRVNMEKLNARAIEAAEQCERHDIPIIEEYKNLQILLANWPKDRMLLYGDETGSGDSLGKIVTTLPKGKYGVLIGPEGGFSQDEHQILRSASFVKPFGLGPRILRADSAAMAALSCVMAHLGDWQNKPHFKAVN